MNRPRVVGILGGMGPAAGADFARLFVQACADHMRALDIPPPIEDTTNVPT